MLELYARAQAARARSQLLAAQLHAARAKVHESLASLQAARDRAERIHELWLAACPERERLRYSATARLQARLATMPVIEQAKGIVMAQFDWTPAEAFDALRRASQRENIKLRDLAARIVATTARAEPAQPLPGRSPVAAHRHSRRAAG